MTQRRTSGWTGLDGAAFRSISHDETVSILQDNPQTQVSPRSQNPGILILNAGLMKSKEENGCRMLLIRISSVC